MSKWLYFLLDWSEVWALFLPLTVLFLTRKQPKTLTPVIVYLWVALVLNGLTDLIMVNYNNLPSPFNSNTYLYNIHSVLRFAFFSIFFIRLPQFHFKKLKLVLPLILLIFLLVNFSLFEPFFNTASLSGNLLAVEAFLLLVYCLQYYLSELRTDSETIMNGPDFWVVTGLSIYVVVIFFIFLFYYPMMKVNARLADNMWNVHNVAFIIFCIFLAKAFYGTAGNKHSN
ncbi:MAG: hypothetical protein RLZZ28_460 [Bacteroidota bacterium]